MLPEYLSFDELAAAHLEGRDFSRTVKCVENSKVAVIAPHGGQIEPHTDIIATCLAGSNFSLYCFLSNLPSSKANLHIASHRFDDLACLNLIASHQYVVAVHGWARRGEALMVGGLDTELRGQIVATAQALGIEALTGAGALKGTHPLNVCNRGQRSRGVQIELTMGLRRSDKLPFLVANIRQALLQRQGLERLPISVLNT
jgi:phage replication-related protein YjqB (UPF0714/DUF867 family)